MKVVVGTVLMLVGLGAVACSDGGEAGGDSGGGGAGANRAIGELEVIGSVLGSTAEERTVPESVAEQKAFVEEQIESKVNGLAIAPHNEDLLDLMGTFSESGAPMVTIDSDLPDSERAIYIGTDSIQ